MQNNNNNSLLTKSEFQYLINTKNNSTDQSISKNFEYKIRSTIRKKIIIFLEKELPLLIENDFLRYNEYLDISNLNTKINNNEKVDLVRKRSRVQIPPKAFSFAHKFRWLMRKNENLRYCI